MDDLRGTTERRRHQRHELEVDITIRTERAIIPGRSLEISESGMSAILPVELRAEERVELSIKLGIVLALTLAVNLKPPRFLRSCGQNEGSEWKRSWKYFRINFASHVGA